MKWNEMTGFRKVVFILGILFAIARLTLTILDVVDILASIDILEDIIGCVSFLSLGIAFWKKESMFPIICFIMSGLQFICIFL